MTSDDKAEYEAAGNFKVGMIPYAFEEGIDTILTNSPSWWAVFENDNTQKAKDFLTWLAGDAGQKFLVEDAGFISPFKSCAYVADDPFAQTITDYTAAGKTSSWHWLKNKASLDQNVLGQLYLDFPWTRTSSASSILTMLWAASRMQLHSHRLFLTRLQITTLSN